ncbi:alpha/beta family hydrolase [Pseudoalteromonas ulvae]|uniref:Alpha/beta hydrolase n=1 Tax=Pseudoalteromonas ulvae TaxID=107327 RepID=A0A244CVB6_PSEDV|nr:alpha/beta family hydrolase [Pseudoalteromonas ulvae]OUL59555.1 alpha/beta hydrolase [Pseudoalteromonas ulvae]
MTIQWFKHPEPCAQFILAHGAGAGKESEFMQAMAAKLAHLGINVGLFNFEYMDKAIALGRKQPPQKADKLIAYFNDILCQTEPDLPLFIGGKSMGGRIASLLACERHVKGVIAFGYPFHPPGKHDKLRTAHFSELLAPLFVIQGERDTFGNREFVSALSLPKTVTVDWINNGDHSLVPTKRSGLTPDQNCQHAASLAAAHINEVLNG